MIDPTKFVERTRRVLLCLAPAAFLACSAPPGTTTGTASGTVPSVSTPTSHGEATAQSTAEAEHALIQGQARGEWLPDEAAREAAEKEKQDYLDNYIDKTTIWHSFRAHSGEYVDCIDRNRQPGMKPGYVIATPPPPPPPPVYSAQGVPAVQNVVVHASETDENGNYMHCPEGTVLHRRVTAQELSRFPTVHDFIHWKSYLHLPSPHAQSKSGSGSDAKTQPDGKIEPYTTFGYGNAWGAQTTANLGMQSTINLWNFYVASPSDDLSLSQTWTQYENGYDIESAEVGVITAAWTPVSCSNACLFLYYTNNDYGNEDAGYNSGYYVWDSSIEVDGDFANYSSYGGTQYEVALMTYVYGGNVWLAYNGTWFAYFYGSDFTHLQDGATYVSWGGQVYNSGTLTVPDYTEMGSGYFPATDDEGGGSNYKYVAYQLHSQYINSSADLIDTTPEPYTNRPGCYNQVPWTADGNIGTSLFIGGTGYDDCVYQ